MGGYQSLLRRLALDRADARAWAMYDWGNSAFVTTIVTAVFPVFFASVAAQHLPTTDRTKYFSWTTTGAVALVALMAPFLGAIADHRRVKKKLLVIFAGLGIVATAAMVTIGAGQWMWAATLFAVSNIGAMGSFIFYDALLPHVAKADEVDRLSTSGYALGYLGGGLLLSVNLLCIQHPTWFGLADTDSAVRACFVAVALWWALFSVPLLRRVSEPRSTSFVVPNETMALRSVFVLLGQTLTELKKHREALRFLLAYLIYNDGIGTIIRMATVFGHEIGLENSALIGAIVMVQFIGIPATFALGQLADRIGAKPIVLVSLGVYAFVCLIGYSLHTAGQFYAMAALVGLVQGACQALSRSIFARLIPAHRSAEFFAFFSISEKFAGIFGPALFAIAIQLTGSSRQAIIAMMSFFLVGGLMLARIDTNRTTALPQTS